MTTWGAEPIFVDTNALVHASEQRSPLHSVAVQAIRDHHAAGAALWISRQVMREYLAVLTRPQLWGNPQPIALLTAEVRRLGRQFYVAEDSPDVTDRLLTLLEQFPSGGKQIHDANIVATMQAHGIRQLLTHNTADFARFSSVIMVIPLQLAP